MSAMSSVKLSLLLLGLMAKGVVMSALPLAEDEESLQYERPLERATIETDHLVPIDFATESSRLPRRKNLKSNRLLRKMGDDFLSDWMSIEDPGKSEDNAPIVLVDQQQREALAKQIEELGLDQLMIEVVEDKQDQLDKNTLISSKSSRLSASQTASTLAQLESLLLQKASCPVTLDWMDLGILFWPRYIRQGRCSDHSCSWPQGMKCESRGSKTLHLLRWHCGSSARSRRRRCRWYKVPYPVTNSCGCGAKNQCGSKY